MSAVATITWTVPANVYVVGDYACLCGNGGSGDIDYDKPLSGSRYEFYPDGRPTCITQLQITYPLVKCGEYKFAIQVYDSLGNQGANPAELMSALHMSPPAPSGLKFKAYDGDTEILILQAA